MKRGRRHGRLPHSRARAVAGGSNVGRCPIYIFRGLRPEAGNAGSRGDLSHILSFVACARLSPLRKLDLLKKRERERDVSIYIYYIEG